jgi:beta-lactamase regulating signal transducer with metallopeptidase domain
MNAVIEAINWAAEAWWPYVLHVTWTSSLVAVLLMTAVWLGRRWPGRLRYCILLIALVKFAVPPTLMMPTGLFSWFGPTVVTESADTPNRGAIGSDSSTAGDFAPVTLSWKAWLMLVHVWGAMMACVGVILQAVKLARLVRRSKVVTSGPVYDKLMQLAREMSLRREVRLLVTSRPIAPMAIGLWRLYVIVPTSVHNRLPSSQVQTVLAHELAHHRRGDLWMNWFQIIMSVLWWFNPILRLLNRKLRHVSEDCCDDLLLSGKLTTGESYCQALLTVAADMGRRPMLGAAMGFAQSMHPLGLRIKRIMDPELDRSPKLSFLTLVPIVAVAALLLPGLPTQAGSPTPPTDVIAHRGGAAGQAETMAMPFTIPHLKAVRLCSYSGGMDGISVGGDGKNKVNFRFDDDGLELVAKSGQKIDLFTGGINEKDTFLTRVNSPFEGIPRQYVNPVVSGGLPSMGKPAEVHLPAYVFSSDTWYPHTADKSDVLPNRKDSSQGDDQYADGSGGDPQPMRSPGSDGGEKGEPQPNAPSGGYRKSGGFLPIRLAKRQPTTGKTSSPYLLASITNISRESAALFEAEDPLDAIASLDTPTIGDPADGRDPFMMSVTATPEPATTCLLIIGGLILLLYHRRNRLLV